MPIGLLAVTRVGIVSTRQLRKNRRYAILVIAVAAMLLPGQDPVTMLSMMIPLYVLYEGSILLCALLDRREARNEARDGGRRRGTTRPVRRLRPGSRRGLTRMLFDLRGAGRQRTVKAVYLTLAILMGGGLVLFGIGGDVSGGLVDAITERNQTSGDSAERFENRERDLVARVQANPQDAAALVELARVRTQLAGLGENFDPEKNTYSAAAGPSCRRPPRPGRSTSR